MHKETIEESWGSRYGSIPPDEMPDLAAFLGHRSIRHYEQKDLPPAWRSALLAAAQSASTSSNLQLWSGVIVSDPEKREAVALLCSDQKQIKTCSMFLVFCADHYRTKRAATMQEEQPTALTTKELFVTAVIDASLAAERLVCAAEYLGLGICYIGAIRNKPHEVKELLDLPEGVTPLFGLCLGFPSSERQAAIKPRLSQSAVWGENAYNREPETDEYDERMREFAVSQQMKTDIPWSKQSGQRCTKGRISGREAFGDFVRSQGMDTE